MGSPQLQEGPVRVYRAVRLVRERAVRLVPKRAAGLVLLSILVALCTFACTTLPAPKFSRYSFPKNAFIEPVTRAYEKVGTVRAKVNFPTLDPTRDEDALCRNYFNKAVADLVRMAQKKGADAVIEVRSVVFYEGAKSDTFSTPECADDGEEGQALAQGIAVKWKTTEGSSEKAQ